MIPASGRSVHPIPFVVIPLMDPLQGLSSSRSMNNFYSGVEIPMVETRKAKGAKSTPAKKAEPKKEVPRKASSKTAVAGNPTAKPAAKTKK